MQPEFSSPCSRPSSNNITERYCPVCKATSDHFAEFGIVPRADAKCTSCGALERHRLVWLYFERRTDLFDGRNKRLLHVGPEQTFQRRLKEYLGPGYLSADLHDPRAMVKMDITRIGYQDATFDVIYCSHVLEHVVDDAHAMRELHRVLKPNGWTIVLVPITADRTIEDPSAITPAQRLQRFGQADHVRRYGRDFVDRLNDTGFSVDVVAPSDFLTQAEMSYMGITEPAGQIHHCTKG